MIYTLDNSNNNNNNNLYSHYSGRKRTREKKNKYSKQNNRRYTILYNNQINARALIGQSALGYCAGKPTEKWRVF